MLRRETMAQAQIITDPQEKTRLELEQKFAKEHSKASDEELLAYLRQRAQELGRLPEKADITGYQLIKSRFGPWPRVLEKAGLKPPTQRKTMREKREATRRRRKEYKKQRSGMRMKLKRITPLIALVIAAILCFTSCSGSNRAAETETSGRLDLDYV